ncbi:MAG TPA: hypothetical protein VII02_02585 [Gemmatimonadaceae bacterium]
MRSAAALLLFLALPASPLSGQSQAAGNRGTASPLVGRWDAVTRSDGGIGVMMTFTADGKMSVVTGAMLDYRYELDGTTLKLFPPGDRAMIATVSFAGDTLVQTAGAESNKLTRAPGSPAGSGILGRWTYMHYTGVPAFIEYSADGMMRLRVPLQTEAGTYVVSGDKLTLRAVTPAAGEKTVQFIVSGDKLTIDPAGQARDFLRIR